MYIFQKGFNYNQDGRGNRLVIHMQGCNLKCRWCCNPESIELARAIDSCKLEGQSDKYMGTAEYKPRYSFVDDDEIARMCLKSKAMMYDGGGVTFTGGEPTVQYESLKNVLQKLKQNGIHTAIETNGTSKSLEKLFPLIDQLIIDYKHYDEKKHKLWTGLGCDAIYSNIISASNSLQDVLVRIPLINGFNASLEDAHAFAAKLKGIKINVELLSYHEFGKVKWEKLNKPYEVTDGYVSKALFNEIKMIFKNADIILVNT